MKYVHTNIISKDWKRLAQFYIDVFQCQLKPPIRNQSGEWLEKGTGVPNAKLTGAHLILPGYEDGGPTLEIFQYENILDQDPFKSNHRGYGHIAFEVDNIKQVYDKALENGAETYGTPGTKYIEGAGTVTFVYIRDPDGNIVELQTWS